MLVKHHAHCRDCDWTCDARNAQGVAQVHANVNNHRVDVQMGYLLTRKPEYTPPKRYKKVPRA